VKDGKEESTNTFISSSLQQSPSTDSSTQEETPVIEKTNALKENINQTISTIVPDEESTSDISKEQKEIMPITPSVDLNPDATPFVALSTSKIVSTQSISTGDESDDEDSNETPVTSGK
jgi:hypothetical protein